MILPLLSSTPVMGNTVYVHRHKSVNYTKSHNIRVGRALDDTMCPFGKGNLICCFSQNSENDADVGGHYSLFSIHVINNTQNRSNLDGKL